jgi:hypothetical protein
MNQNMNKLPKERTFEDKKSRITSEMIDGSNSQQELLDWKLIIESNAVAAQMLIDEMRGEHARTGVFADIKKWTGTNGYRRVLGFLSQKIQHKLRQIKYDEAEANKPMIRNECISFLKWVLRNIQNPVTEDSSFYYESYLTDIKK